MPDTPSPSTTQRAVDGLALRRSVQRLVAAPQPPWLHGEVARRMAERLVLVRQKPARVIDWWAHLGGGSEVLRQGCPGAVIQPVEPLPVPTATRPWWSSWLGSSRPAPLQPSAVPDGQAQLVWANMMLHLVADPMVTLRHWHRVLAVDGFLMFTTLGPGSLAALRRLYAEQGWGPPMAPLVDMHDLGDMLVEAGFADPVMDQESLRLTWRNAAQALAELRSLGSNSALERVCGCRTPRWRRQLEAGLERVATRQGTGPDAGVVELEFEIVYGHAFKPQPRVRVASETTLPVNDLRALLRGSRRPPG